jgi:hypothetical protein
VIGVVVAVGGLSTAVSAHTTTSTSVSAAVGAHLRSIIVAFARENGDRHATHLRMVETASTYRLAASGHFIGYAASIPPGAAPPTGIGLWTTLERNSGFTRLVAWGISRTDVNLRRYGKVLNL